MMMHVPDAMRVKQQVSVSALADAYCDQMSCL